MKGGILKLTLMLPVLLLAASCGKEEYLGSPDKPGKTPEPEQADTLVTNEVLYKNGESIGSVKYTTFRIPSLVRTDNKVIALCEARTEDSDACDIDIACRISTDEGKTWGDKKVLFSDSNHTVGNPCCVYTSTGRLVMVFNWQVSKTATGKSFPSELGVTYEQNKAHSRRVFVTWSDNGGETWSTPKDITDDVMEKNWTWNAAGPCHAIQLQNGAHKGRIIVPCDNKYSGTLPSGRDSYVIYSDDNGVSWKKSDVVNYGNECCAVELSDGRVMLDMRNVRTKYYDGQNCRAWSISSDGGQTWQGYNLDSSRPEPTSSQSATQGCQGSVINYNPDGKISSNLIFSNPANASSRKNMTLRFSTNDGQKWQKSMLITSNPSGYSDLVVLKGGAVGLLYETGSGNYHQTITFARIPQAIISDNLK